MTAKMRRKSSTVSTPLSVGSVPHALSLAYSLDYARMMSCLSCPVSHSTCASRDAALTTNKYDSIIKLYSAAIDLDFATNAAHNDDNNNNTNDN